MCVRGVTRVRRFGCAGERIAREKIEAEQAAGKPLPMSFVTDPETGAIESDRRNGLANTHIIWHGDQLLALEEGSHPFSMAPDT